MRFHISVVLFLLSTAWVGRIFLQFFQLQFKMDLQLPVDTFKYELKREYLSQLTFLYIRPLNTFGTGYDEI